MNSAYCSRCVCTWMVKYREYISLLVILCIIVYVTNKKNKIQYIVFFPNRYPIMVKYLNIWKNIGKPIYQWISDANEHSPLFLHINLHFE